MRVVVKTTRCTVAGCAGFANSSGRCPPHDGRSGSRFGGRCTRGRDPDGPEYAERQRARMRAAVGFLLLHKGRLP